MSLLRKDAKVTIYVLKHKQSDGTWASSSMDHFKFSDTEYDGTGRMVNGSKKHFMASGECWQQHGIHGAMSLAVGMEGLREIAQANPKHEFSLFEIELSQISKRVATMHLGVVEA